MELLMLVLCVIPTIVTSITISSNGNSPEIKMIGGMMMDVQNGGFMPIAPEPEEMEAVTANTLVKNPKLTNTTKLSLNERYRRLIPYMTFYYANDLASTTEGLIEKDVEVEKAEIVETGGVDAMHERQPKKLMYSPFRHIPKYQGNRLTPYNIASSNPTKIYKDVPVYHQSHKVTPNYKPLLPDHSYSNPDFGRIIQKPIVKAPSIPFGTPTRKPYINLYNDEIANVQYYLNEKEPPKYKLVPYEQTPPVKVPQAELYESRKPIPVPVLMTKEPIYVKPRPARPQYFYDNINISPPRKQPITISESYYEKQRPHAELSQPVVESGFRPIINPLSTTTERPVYDSLPEAPLTHYENERPHVQVIDNMPDAPEYINYKPKYEYVVEQPAYYKPAPVSTKVNLGELLNSLQLNRSIPKPITKDNVGTSIQTLLQVLNALKAMQSHQNEAEAPVLSTPKPFVPQKVVVEVASKPVISTPVPEIVDPDFHEEPYLAPVNTPSQHLDEFSSNGGSSQHYPLQIQSEEEGGTPGRPGVDYPILTTIPQTSFNCKTQRYKGFFADTETRCQVWHYCDLNGGQASFLCPNGTIFSQAGLTCDWWFNVRCASTTQLYVLNESLYKYILPHSPKFPEDYSGPLVDKYLTLKFKEMEEQFKKNKKKVASEKMDSEESDAATDKMDAAEKTADGIGSVMSVSEASVLVQSPGSSGNVERLEE